MAAQSQATNNTDLFDAYFRRADLDGDGRISGGEAVVFFRGSNLPQNVLAQVWNLANQNKADFLSRIEFYNALKLVTVAQNKRELTPDIVKAALFGPASSKIPAPQINISALPSHLNSNVPLSVANVARTSPAISQNSSVRGPHVLTNSNTTPQHFTFQQNQSIRPSQAMPLGVASNLQQTAPSHEISGNVLLPSPELRPQNRNNVPNSSIPQNGFGLGISELPTAQSKSLATNFPTTPSFQAETNDSKVPIISGNRFISNLVPGDVSSGVLSQPKQESVTPTVSDSLTSSMSPSIVSSTLPSIVSVSQPDSFQSLYTSHQRVGDQHTKMQSIIIQNQQGSLQSSTAFMSSSFPTGTGRPPRARDSSSSQSHLQWPRMTHSDVQKYTKVFLEVDTDKDGKISGVQARNLFLSWKLPREVLKQVWDLSDQDNDSMLSLREFCISLYLMERHREGHPLPTVLPVNISFDENLFSNTGQSSFANNNAFFKPGLQQPQEATVSHLNPPIAEGKPPIEKVVSPTQSTVQPSSAKSRVPVLEKHLVHQLSSEEQNSLNSKFKEAADADKKVVELEKEILDSKQKIEFYRTKMQELILYKSKCDNRLNEIIERISVDKRELDLLIKKYEERCKQVGDVASKLTSEEATFRDIQEKKMELYQAIMKIEQAGPDGNIQVDVDRIQSELEDLVKALNERCKKYGLRAKPTTLTELPFGWQSGIQDNAADWDEDWDNLEDEGFTFVKEFTLDVKNITAPPKVRSSLAVPKVEESADEDAVSCMKSEKSATISEESPKNISVGVKSRDSPISPAERSVLGSPSHAWTDLQSSKSIELDGSPHVRDTHSDDGGAESVVSEVGWGAFDSHDDTDSVWGFNPSAANTKERFGGSLFDLGDVGVEPIRTTFPKTSPFAFADSIPNTPVINFTNSPTLSEDRSFSRFDSFNMNDAGFFGQRDSSFARFDSIRSSRDSDHGPPSFDDSDPFKAHV